MSTTFEKYAGKPARNYCDNPTKDVEILECTPECSKCAGEMRWDPKGGGYGWGTWVHVGDTDCRHWAPRATCAYCGTNEAGVVVRRQHAWYDAVECSRCGGMTGWSIGD